ncbi:MULTISPECIES: CHAP domain-containing protein [unclassified Nocardioides]|uniref:CHAP domain-containing protein n=1 Tax=unclassified Nocardioides TaxID=2615069 RepID=UPI0036154F12
MSSFIKPLRHALASPVWLFVIVMAIGMTVTSIAAAHAEPEPEVSVTSDPGSSAIDPDRRPAVSRSGDRTAVRAERVKQANRVERKPVRPALPLAQSNATQTVASAMASAYNVPGQCLAWVREQAGVPSRYADATTAWQHAAGRHPDDVTPPRGAAVYWTGGSSGYGHVAISLGNGMVRSSDAGGTGAVATVPIRYFDREWGQLRYAGWATSINGYRIPGVAGA